MSEVVANIINDTLASGVEPLRRLYHGIYDGYDDVAIAYVSETEIFLTVTGRLPDYESKIDLRPVGIKWSVSNIVAAYRALQKLREKGKRVRFITAFVTTSFLEGDVESALTDLAAKGITGEGIVLAIREKTILTSVKARKGIEMLRAMGYGAAIYGFSGQESLTGLTEAAVDYVFLTESLTALSGDRDKPGLFTALMTLLRALRCEIVLCGVKNDDVIRDATASECFGVMPSAAYEGEFSFPKAGQDIAEILSTEDGTL